MKRKALVKRISQAARETGVEWSLAREGGNHTMYQLGSLRIPIPRHREIDEHLALAIFKQAEPELGQEWWK